MRPFAALSIAIIALVAASCGKSGSRSEAYSGVAPSDPRLAEFSDMLSVNRAALGLPALPSQLSFWVERTGGGSGRLGSAGGPHPAISAATITITWRTARL